MATQSKIQFPPSKAFLNCTCINVSNLKYEKCPTDRLVDRPASSSGRGEANSLGILEVLLTKVITVKNAACVVFFSIKIAEIADYVHLAQTVA